MANKELESGELVGTYRVVRKVGEGGMGEVYEAWDDNLNRAVALKIMNDAASKDSEMVERFRGEGRVLARLRHPNVVALYAQGDHSGCPYMVMEYIDGMTVDEFLIHHPCSLTALVDFFRQMLEGLGAAHTAGIIHRDIKPQNIIVGQDLQVKIIDFGVAKDHADHLSHQTTVNMVVGTAHYFAPEMVLGKMANPQTDLFSLGMVFYYMVTGERPFDGKSNLEILEKIRTTDMNLGGKNSTIMPEALRNVFSRLTKRNPSLRYRTAKEALDELDAVNLNELPGDLCIAPSPRIFIANAAEVRRLCTDNQLNHFESSFAINLAIEAYRAETPTTDATQAINTAPVVNLSETSVIEGVRKFRQARGTIVSRKTMSQPYYVEPQPRSRTGVAMPLMFVVVAGCSGWLFMKLGKTLNATVPQRRAAVKAQNAAPPSVAAPVTAPVTAPAVPAPAVPSRQQASVNPVLPPNTYPLPDLKAGTRFTVLTKVLQNKNVTNEVRRNWELESATKSLLTFRGPDNALFEELPDGISPFLKYIAPSDFMPTKVQFIKNSFRGDPMALFPLRIGNKVTYEVDSANRLGTQGLDTIRYNQTCVALRNEKITVGAGQFDTILIECKTDRAPITVQSIYYAPRLQRWAKIETFVRDQNNNVKIHVIHEIVGFALPR